MEVLTFVWDGLATLMNDLLPYTTNSNFKYIITGHSLGGAMATLFSLLAKQNAESNMWIHWDSCLITFGENRLGNKAFADLHDEQISPNRKVRFVYNRDIVPHLPHKWQDFLHQSREVWLGREYVMHNNGALSVIQVN